MGVSYYGDRTTWSSGPTSESPTDIEDSLSILASSTNGFGYVPDDYGNTIATATALPISSSHASASGLIGKNDDRDVFKFTTSGGSLSFSLAVAQYGPNLDGVLELQNAAGQTIVTANPSNSFGASLTTTVAAGTYYLVVRSSGGYGNLGRYTLSGDVPTSSTTPQPPTSTPQPVPPGEVTPPPSNAGPRIVDDGTATFTSSGSWRRLTGAGYSGDTQWASANTSATSTWTFANLAPGQYRVAATWSGSGMNATDSPFTILDGSRRLSTVRVNQQRSAGTFTSGGASWQNLGTFTVTANSLTVRLNSSTSGRVVADAIRLERVGATSGGAALRSALPTGAVDAALADVVQMLNNEPLAIERIAFEPPRPVFRRRLADFQSAQIGRLPRETVVDGWDGDTGIDRLAASLESKIEFAGVIDGVSLSRIGRDDSLEAIEIDQDAMRLL
jgi:hypothetical protein